MLELLSLLENFFIADFEFCRDGVLNTFKLVGIAITIIKILIPLLLIIFGTIDFGKAVVSDDAKAIKSSSSLLVKRVIAGIIIFFIPTILKFVFGLVYDSTEATDFENCTKCMMDTSACDCILDPTTCP